MSSRRTIHCQGDLDGACFLYSAANAYTALTGRRPCISQWATAVRALPHARDFLDPTCGTTNKYEEKPALLGHALEGIFAAVAEDGPKIEFTWHPEAGGFEDVAELIDARGVALFRYSGDTRYARRMDHWVCGVAVRRASPIRPLRIYAACSARWVETCPDSRYRERPHRSGRFSNDVVIDDGRAELVNGCVFQLRLAPVEIARLHPERRQRRGPEAVVG